MEIVERMRKLGYPLKIIGNGGFPATLIGYQPLLDGEFCGVYRYPGGDCVHSLDEIDQFCKVIER